MRTKERVMVIDIGNSTLSYAFLDGNRITRHGHVIVVNIPSIKKIIMKRGSDSNTDKYIICSVVPEKTAFIEELIQRYNCRAKPFILKRNMVPKFPARYDMKKLGVDRLANVYWGRKHYEWPVLVVDFGTAIKFDYVSVQGVYEGGLIVPGVEIALKTLLKEASLLPKRIKLEDVRDFIGRETRSAILSGSLNGFGVLADGLIERFSGLSKRRLTVVATGGLAKKMARYAKRLDVVDPLHTIRSLVNIYRERK